MATIITPKKVEVPDFVVNETIGYLMHLSDVALLLNGNATPRDEAYGEAGMRLFRAAYGCEYGEVGNDVENGIEAYSQRLTLLWASELRKKASALAVLPTDVVNAADWGPVCE